MNNVDKKPDYKKLWKEAEKLFKKSNFFSFGGYDETFCTIRVFETAKQIMKKMKNEKVNKQAVLVAAIFHDVGKSIIDVNKVFKKDGRDKKTAGKEWDKHSKLSPIIARKILKKHKHSTDFIKIVSEIILKHDERNNKNNIIEVKILQDADLVADSGFVEVIRAFSYTAQFKRSILEGIKRINKFGLKRYNLSNLNLKVSKELMKEKNNFLRMLKNKLHALTKSELLE